MDWDERTNVGKEPADVYVDSQHSRVRRVVCPSLGLGSRLWIQELVLCLVILELEGGRLHMAVFRRVEGRGI